MTNTDLLKLRDALAKATEPSRGLDQAMARLFGWKPSWTFEGETRFYEPGKHSDSRMAPMWTASIADAVALVEGDDRFWRVGHDGEGPDPSAFKAEILGPHVSRKISATADTPALALCLARVEYEISKHEAAEDESGPGAKPGNPTPTERE